MTNRPEEGVADDEAVRWARDETEKHKGVQKGPRFRIKLVLKD